MTDTDADHDADAVALTPDECWNLVSTTELCRLAFVQADGAPDIRPVNHLCVDRVIYIRSALDSKFLAVASRSPVAVEVDGADDADFWSVVVRGVAMQVTSESELHRVGVEHLRSWTAAPKQFVLKVTASTITGRRFPRRALAAPPVYAVPATEDARAAHHGQRGERPDPIPHFEPPPGP
ncbi:pyridoxamine 5'-phosphate oxidase family protein [Microbacterium sp. NPDC089320]|uniref:pyridoxamine 5'-phosphate oxidase family protein n=1 Tax=Microbacterium sp. NPDC089320 TaxID=3155182 RepID=UPI003449B353